MLILASSLASDHLLFLRLYMYFSFSRCVCHHSLRKKKTSKILFQRLNIENTGTKIDVFIIWKYVSLDTFSTDIFICKRKWGV